MADLITPGRDSADARLRGLQHPFEPECRLTRIETVEQALAGAEYHRTHLQVDLIDQAGPDGLPGAGRAAGYRDGPVASGCLGSGVSGLDPSVMKWKVVPPPISIGSCS